MHSKLKFCIHVVLVWFLRVVYGLSERVTSWTPAFPTRVLFGKAMEMTLIIFVRDPAGVIGHPEIRNISQFGWLWIVINKMIHPTRCLCIRKNFSDFLLLLVYSFQRWKSVCMVKIDWPEFPLTELGRFASQIEDPKGVR